MGKHLNLIQRRDIYRNIFAILLVLGLFMSCLTKKIAVTTPPPPPPPPPPALTFDTDNDGISDDVDKCPTVPGVAKYNGCPIPDTDGDDINDEKDKCPTVPGLPRYNGCPIPDTDGDGVNDEEDQCITVAAETISGCPEVGQPVRTKPETIVDSAIFIPIRPGQVEGTTPTSPPITDSTGSSYPNASLAYNFYNKMKKGDKVPIQITVELYQPLLEVEDRLRQSTKAQQAVQVSRSDSAITKSLLIKGDKYFFIEVKAADPDVFDIELIVGKQKQELKRGLTNKWVWQLTAKKEAKNSEVYIIVTPLREGEKPGEREPADYTILPVQITVDFSLTEFLKMNWPYLFILIGGLGLVAYLVWKKRPANSIFLSYAWNTEEEFIKSLYKSLKRKFNILIDNEDMENQGRISKFMTEIGKGKIIIVALSDKYLKSPFCMNELYEIYVNAGMNADTFAKRVFPIRLEDINLSNKDVVNKYQLYWKAEKEKWEKQIAEDSGGVKSQESRQSETFRRIEGEVENILYLVGDIKAFFPDKLLQTDFKELKDAVRARLNEKG